MQEVRPSQECPVLLSIPSKVVIPSFDFIFTPSLWSAPVLPAWMVREEELGQQKVFKVDQPEQNDSALFHLC